MAAHPTYQDLADRVAELEKKCEKLEKLEAINNALYEISSAVNSSASPQEMYRLIHRALSAVIDTTNFYISIYDSAEDSLTFPYIFDTVDIYYPEVVNVSRTASLTAEVIRSRKPLLINKNDIIKRQNAGDLAPVHCTPAATWLGVPLQAMNHTIGVMAVQSYTDADCYDLMDMKVLESVADMVAISLDRKFTEEALRDSEKNFRQIVTTVNEGSVSLDTDNRIVFANAFMTEIFGYKIAELQGQPFSMLIHEEDRGDFLRRQSERQKGKTEQFERRFKTRDGREFWAIVAASPRLDSDGKIVGSLGTITDITERKKAETELQNKNLELQDALNQIKTLRGIVPICMNCKKIRDDKGFWNQVEVYVRNHTEAEFSHGMCRIAWSSYILIWTPNMTWNIDLNNFSIIPESCFH